MAAIELEKDLRVAVSIALEAGKFIRDTCGYVKSVETKQSFADLVTETDKNVEKFIFDKLRVEFPADKLIGEESFSSSEHGVSLSSSRTWIVDPVDGR